MDICTTIQARRDGTVIAKVGERVYVFSANDSCIALACSVANQDDAQALLETGQFYVPVGPGTDQLLAEQQEVAFDTPLEIPTDVPRQIRRGRPPKA